MATEVFADWVKETTSTTGTGTITLGGAASADVMAISDSGVADGDIVPYSIIDGNNREVGLGTYTAAGTTLARTTVLATWVSGVYDDTAPTAMSLSGSAEVFLDINSFQAMSKTDTQFTNELYRTTATLNGTAIDGHVNLGSGTSVTGTAAQAYDNITISGGHDNTATHAGATIGGGGLNSVTKTYGTIGGGGHASNTTYKNSVTGNYGTVSGGLGNLAQGGQSTAGGGEENKIYGGYGTIAGGWKGWITTNYGSILGGRGNRAAHTHSTAFGGASETRANFDVVFGATDSSTSGVANNTIRLQATGGNIKIDGAVTSPEADYAEMFEWYDQNPDNEDRVGYFVSLHEGKIVRGAGRSDKSGVANYLASAFTSPNSATSVPMIGIISATPSVIGDSAPNHWNGRHVKDKFKRVKKDSYTRYEWEEDDGEGNMLPRDGYVSNKNGKVYKEYPQYTHKGHLLGKALPAEAVVKEVVFFPQVDSAYDPNIPYIPREDRKEWDAVGMMGKLIVHSAEPITSNYVRSSQDGRALNGTASNGWPVLEIIDNQTVCVLFSYRHQ